jgi:hypothetical protein
MDRWKRKEKKRKECWRLGRIYYVMVKPLPIMVCNVTGEPGDKRNIIGKGRDHDITVWGLLDSTILKKIHDNRHIWSLQ